MAITDIQRALEGFRWKRPLSGSNNGVPPHAVGFLPSAYSFTPNGGNACGIRRGDPVRLNAGYLEIAEGFEQSTNTAETVLGIVDFIEYYDAGSGVMVKGHQMASGGGVYGSNLGLITKVTYVPVEGQIFSVDLDVDETTVDSLSELYALQDGFADHILSTTSTDYVRPKLDASDLSGSAGQWRFLGVDKTMLNQDPNEDNFKVLVTPYELQRTVA